MYHVSFLNAVIYFRFTQEIYEISEDAGDASVCVELSQAALPLESEVWLSVTSEDDTAIGKLCRYSTACFNGSFTSSQQVFTFMRGPELCLVLHT